MKTPQQMLIDEIRRSLIPIARRIHLGDGDHFIEQQWMDIVDQIKELEKSAIEAAAEEKRRDAEEQEQR